MKLLLLSFGVLVAGAVLSLLLARYRACRFIGPASTVVGCILGLFPAITHVICGSTDSLRLAWQIPFGSLAMGVDPLSAFFLFAILSVSALSAIFGSGYLEHFEGRKNIGLHWFFFNLLVVSMLMVVVARNALLFLLAWEIMSLTSFFLVMFEYEKDSVRKAGWTYLVATHIGTAFLLVMFLLLGRQGGMLDFESFILQGEASHLDNIIFLFAIIGFGTKAGFMPFHVWLPEAHPAAPSHVSALMSGVMIKTGIYGILRVLSFLGLPAPWWGWLVILIGIVSGICGVLFALAQHDYKRLLAYHSVENIGIIALGLGIGILGISNGNSLMAFLGFAGGLLHVINHAVFKSLLFLGAGSVLHATATREIDHLGGLLKKMPVTAGAFLVGSVAICGLPPLNGFVSEFLVYVGAFEGMSDRGLSTGVSVGSIMTVAALALIGGLAVACFTKIFGIIFLGEPRSGHYDDVHESGTAMLAPMIVLMVACVVMGLWGPLIFDFMPGVVSTLVPGADTGGAFREYLFYRNVLQNITFFSLALIAIIAASAGMMAWLMSKRTKGSTVTWDCGYVAPNPRMQYTASSFAQPITKFYRTFLRTKRRVSAPDGLFPKTASFSSETGDFYREKVYKPTFNAFEGVLSKFRQIQHGRLNLYILYIVVALVVLLLWKLRS